MKQSIIQNQNLDSEFKKNGIIKIDFISEKKLAHLKELCHKLLNNITIKQKKTFFFSLFSQDNNLSTKIHEALYPLIKPNIDSVFSNYKILGIVVMVKGIGINSKINIHQDLSVVDESNYSAATLWIPLTESKIENGTIRALPKSHNVFRSYRAHTIDYNHFVNVADFIHEKSNAYHVNKGQALIFDPGTIHYSEPNLTDDIRISITASIVDKNAPVQIGYHDKSTPNNDVEIYNVPNNFWYLYNNIEKERYERPAFGCFSHLKKGVVIKEYIRDEFIKSYSNQITQ